MLPRPRASLTVLIRRLIAAMVAIPIGVIVLYPWYYLILPESRQILADLPQDLLLILTGEAILAPVILLVWYIAQAVRSGRDDAD